MENKKKVIFIIVGAIVVVLLIVGIIYFVNKKKENNISMEFNHLILRTSSSMAGFAVEEITKTADGYLVEYYYEIDYYDSDKEEEIVNKQAYHSRLLSDEEYVNLCQTLKDLKVYDWDGFSKTNSDVMDGDSFSLEIELTSGAYISASGSNSYPKNYRDFSKLIDNLTRTELLKDTHFVTDKYELTLPLKWVDNLTVSYDDGCISFIHNIDDTDVYFFMIFENDYGYYDGDDYLKLGTITNGDETYYLFCKKGSSVDSYKEQMSDELKDIVNTLDDDLKEIVASFKVKDGYTLIGE